MTLMSGKRALLELLRQEGIDIIFGNPGTTELPLMDALATEEGIRYVLGLQEGAILAMADGYSQASGRLSFVNLHAAPGLGNAMGMLYDAKMAGSPVILTAGQQEKCYGLTEPILWTDLVTVAKPFVKWSYEVERTEDLPRALHRAAKTALAPPSGPVFLSLPGDVLTNEANLDLLEASRIGLHFVADPDEIRRAAELILSSERPLIFAGDAISKNHAHSAAVEFAERIGAPVYAESIASTASFPASHPLFEGAMVRWASTIRDTLKDYDLIVSLGGDLFTQSVPDKVDVIPSGMKIIHLDTDPWEIAKSYPTEVGLFGNPSTTLPALLAEIDRKADASWNARAEKRRQAVSMEVSKKRSRLINRAKEEAAHTPIRALGLLHAIGEALPSNAIVVEETLSSGFGIRQLLKSDDPQSFYGLRGGAIGWGIPAAIGIKLALPERPVVALVGDGSSLYTCQALWTAAHEKIGVIFVILNNGGYRILKQRAKAMQGLAAQTGVYVGMDLANPSINIVGLAQSFGVNAVRVDSIALALESIKSGLASNEPLVIDVELDQSF